MLQTRTVPHRNGRDGMTETYHGDPSCPPEYDGVPEEIGATFIFEGAAEDCAGVVLREDFPEPVPEPFDPNSDPEPAEDPELSTEDDAEDDLDEDPEEI